MGWVVYGVAALVLLCLPVTYHVIRPDTGGVEPLDLTALAMLGGGPARVVDAVVTDLAERGEISAADGMLSAVPGRSVRLVSSSVIANSVAAHGPVTLATVRDQACGIGFVFEMDFLALTRQRLAVSPLRRHWSASGWALSALGVLFVVSFGVLTAGLAAWALSVLLSVAISGLVLALALRRPGFHGRDPRTARGLELLRRIAADPGGHQATRVAAGGFAAMTDPRLRAAIQGEAPESAWPSGHGSSPWSLWQASWSTDPARRKTDHARGRSGRRGQEPV